MTSAHASITATVVEPAETPIVRDMKFYHREIVSMTMLVFRAPPASIRLCMLAGAVNSDSAFLVLQVAGADVLSASGNTPETAAYALLLEVCKSARNQAEAASNQAENIFSTLKEIGRRIGSNGP